MAAAAIFSEWRRRIIGVAMKISISDAAAAWRNGDNQRKIERRKAKIK